jgi:hypothetical protein
VRAEQLPDAYFKLTALCYRCRGGGLAPLVGQSLWGYNVSGLSGRHDSRSIRTMTRSPWIWPAIIILSGVGAGVVALGNVESPIRPLIALWFLFVCPGMAFVRLLRLGEGLSEWPLAIALSLALDVIVAAAMLYAGAWSPRWGLVALICLSFSGAILQIVAGYSGWALKHWTEEST